MDEEHAFASSQKEKEFLDTEKEKNPELFSRTVSTDDDAVLRSIGIENVFGERPLGHIKLFPEDFIVEEVSRDDKLHSIEDETTSPACVSGTEEIRTVWADLVKMGIDSIEAVNEISRQLGIEKKQISVAGIKDKYALTGQWISLRGIRPEQLHAIQAENFFLKNTECGKGALQIGDLSGNRFTIFLRTQVPLDQTKLETALVDLEEQGFWNFFYLQRFGNPRLVSHKLGLLILQGKFEEAVRGSLVGTSEREIPYFQNARNKIKEAWGDWKTIEEITRPLAYSFRNERKMLSHIQTRPGDFAGALNTIPEQVKLWVYAYSSFLFNTLLSSYVQNADEVPFSIPLALSPAPAAKELYREFFQAHNIAPPFPALKHFPYVQKQEREVETLKKFSLKGVGTTEQGVVIDFILDKGSYATTFLSHLFTLSSGTPLPEGISTAETDSKKILGTGTIEPLREGKFKKLFEMRNLENGLTPE